MSGKKIPIPIARFEADRLLSCEVYLHLSLNRRSVRIANSGETLDGHLLEKIRSKGHTHLEVTWDEAKGEDPSTYPLYAETNSAAPAPTPAGAHNEPTGESAAVILKASTPDEQGSELVKGDEQIALDVIKVSGSAEVEGSILVKGARDEDEGSTHLRSASSESEGPNSFAKSPAGAEEAEIVRGDSDQTAEENRFSPSADSSAESLLKAGAKDSKESAEKLQGEEEVEEDESRFSQIKPSQEVVYQVSSKEGQESAIFRLEQKLESAKEQLLSGGTFGLAKEKANILKDAKSSILASKISDRIIELKKQPSMEGPAELEVLKTSLKSAEAGDELSPESEERFSVSKEMKAVEGIFSAQKSESEKVLELSEQLATFAKSRETAKSLLEEEEQNTDSSAASASSHRDLPIAASKLAAYLGLALGYVNQRYLTDLSVSAIAHFSRKEGKELKADALPDLAKPFFSKGNLDAAASDSVDVIAFLDFYLSDPECDKTQKEFSKKIFERISLAAEQSKQFDPWHLKCWETFVERGPTMETHSLCTRASAQALKIFRSASGE